MITLRLKELCKANGITLNELAERIGVSRVSVYNIASGKQKPAFDTLEKFAAAFGVSVSELFAPAPTNVIICPHCGKAIRIEQVE